MALIQLGGGVTDIRGSMAGNTFSRSAAGNYMRSRKKPINPRSTLQNTRRATVAYLTRYWSHDLTEQQRTDWRAYATGTSWTNKLGQAVENNGLSAFLRLNTLRYMNSLSVRDAAPTAMGHGGGCVFTFLAENDTTKLQIAEPTGAFDKDTDNHRLDLFCGLPTEPGRHATPKGFKHVGYVYGHSVTPLAFPYELDAPYTMQAGQFITMRAMFQDEDMRIGGPYFATVTAAPSI